MKERWPSLLFYLFVPSTVIWLFHATSTKVVTWGNYASLSLRLYDLFASDVFSIIITFVSVQLMILRVVGERSPYGTLDRDLIAIPRYSMYLGKLLCYVVFILIQVIAIYVFGYILFPARNYGNAISIIIIMFMMSLFGLLLGYAISIYSKNKEQAIQLSPFLILILLLLSGILIPIDQMSIGIETIAKNAPLTLGTQSLKMITLDGVGFEDVQSNMLKLFLWCFFIAFFSIIKFNLEKRK